MSVLSANPSVSRVATYTVSLPETKTPPRLNTDNTQVKKARRELNLHILN